MLGEAFLKRADQQKYGKLMTSIRDQHSFKKDVYPKTLHEAYELLENHSSSKVHRNADQGNSSRRGAGNRGRGGREGRGRRGRWGREGRGRVGVMQFTQSPEATPGSDGRTVARITCFKCNKTGHYSDFCPDNIEGNIDGEQNFVNAYELTMGEDDELNDEVESEAVHF